MPVRTRGGREQERSRPEDDELAEQVAERAVTVVEGCRCDDDAPALLTVDRSRQQAPASVDPGHMLTLEPQLPARLDPRELLLVEQRLLPCLGDDAARPVDHLRPGLIGVRLRGLTRDQVLHPALQRVVDRLVERRAEPEIDQRAGRGEHDGHRNREGQRQPRPDRQPVHGSPLKR